jgi:hypothetical protein
VEVEEGRRRGGSVSLLEASARPGEIIDRKITTSVTGKTVLSRIKWWMFYPLE